MAIEDFFATPRRGGVPRARGGRGRRAARARRRRRVPGGLARRRRGHLRPRAGGAAPPHRRPARRRLRHGLAARGRPAAAGARPAALRRAARRARRRCTSGSPTRSCPPAGATRVRHALPGVRALAAAPARREARLGGGGVGRLPGLRRRGPGRGRLLAARRAGASPSPTRTSPPATGPADHAIPAGEEHKTLATAERVLRAMAAAGVDHDDHVGALGGGVVGDVAGFCAAVYQRGIAGRAGADDGRRPGRLGLRRQDRASTCPRARTTPAPTTSRRPCSPTRRSLATLPAAEARGRAGPRSSRPR